MPRQKPQPLPIVLEKDIRFLGRFISATLDDPTINRLRAYHTDKKPVKTIVRLTSAGLTIGEKPSKLSRIKSLYEFIPNYDVHTMTIDRLQRDVVLCIVNLGIAQYEITALRFNTDPEASIFVHAFDEVTNRKPHIDDRSPQDRQPIASVLTKEADTNTTYSLASINPRASLGGGMAGSKEFRNWSLSRREQRRRHSNQTPTVYSFSTTGGGEKEEYLSASRSLQNVLLKANGVATLPRQQPGKPFSIAENNHHQQQQQQQHQEQRQPTKMTHARKQQETSPKMEPQGDDTASHSFAYRKAPARRQRQSVESVARAFEEQRQATAARSVGVQDTVSEESINNVHNIEKGSNISVVGSSSTNVLRPSTSVNGVKAMRTSASVAEEQDAWDYTATGSLQRSDRVSTVSQVSDSVRDEISSIHREVRDIKDLLGMLHKQFTDKDQNGTTATTTTGKGVSSTVRDSGKDGSQPGSSAVRDVDVDRLERKMAVTMERVERKYGKENNNSNNSSSGAMGSGGRYTSEPATVRTGTGGTHVAVTGTVRRRPQQHLEGQQPTMLRLQSEIEEEAEMEMRTWEGVARAIVADRREPQQLTLVRSHSPPAGYSHPSHQSYGGTMSRSDYHNAHQYVNSSAAYQQAPHFSSNRVSQPAAYPTGSLRGTHHQEYIAASAGGGGGRYSGHQAPLPPHRLAPSNQHPPLHHQHQLQQRPIASAHEHHRLKTNVPIEIIELVPIKQDRGRSAKKSKSKQAKKSGSKSGSKSRSTSREWSQNDSVSRGDRSASRDSSKRANNVGFSIDQPQRHSEVVTEIARHSVKQAPRLYEVVRI